MWYDGLNDKRMWSIFEEISRVPRESGNEEGIRNFLLSWAKENGFRAERDEIGNVFIYANASEGYENVPPIALQGHMDMVCVKKDGSSHDFTKDPIEIEYDGKFIKAKDTTLGADNGIAIAMSLALISDPECHHGPIEIILTISEETGLTGAFNIDPEKVRAKRMINLDSEEEGILYIGCAGGVDLDSTLSFKKEENQYTKAYRIEVSGLLGGHSGGEIDKERGNAIKILARALKSLGKFSFSEIEGGTKKNVIPSYAYAIVATDSAIMKKIEKVEKEVRNELKNADPNVRITVTPTENPALIIPNRAKKRIIDALFSAPHGVRTMSTSIKGIVETSNNLAIVRTSEESITVTNSIRSNIGSSKENNLETLKTLYSAFGFKNKASDGYPEWEPNLSSPLLKEVEKLYKEITGKKPKVTAIHAGLECGIINKRIKGMDSLSLGPDLFDVHSVNEHIVAQSAERISSLLKEMVSRMR